MSKPTTPVPMESSEQMWDVVIQTRPLALSKPKLSRTSAQKVRTGCITCKKRHVKCDEARPACNNCLKSRGHCEGYVSEPRKRAPGPFQSCWDSRQPLREATPPIQLQIAPVSPELSDSKSLLYFQEFLNLVQAPWIAGAPGGNLWSATLPQLTSNEGALRSAATAIGALSVWHRQSTPDPLHKGAIENLSVAERNLHYSQAVSYYCRALKFQSQNTSIPSTIFLSLLLLFFETLRGNRKTALEHINHALALFFAALTDDDANRHVSNFGPNPRPLLAAVSDIFTLLATQVRAILPERIDSGPPLPNLTMSLKRKKESIESFMVLLSQLPNSSVSANRIPDSFSSLEECEEYWAAVRRRQISMATIVRDLIEQAGIPRTHDQATIDKFYMTILGDYRIQEFCNESRANIKKMNDALSPLFDAIVMSDPESPRYLRALHLRLQLFGAYVFEDPPGYLFFESVQSRTPLHREFLNLAEMALRLARREMKNPAHQFSLQCGLAWHILILALFCRDPFLREQASCMLKDYPGQDGLWNTRALYALSKRNRHVERRNALEGTSQEQWGRLRRREYVFEEAGERIILRYFDKDDTTGEWDLIEEATTLQEDSEDEVWTRQPLSGSGGLLMLDLYAT